MQLTNYLRWHFSNQSFVGFDGTTVTQNNGGGTVVANTNNAAAFFSNSLAGSYIDVGFGNTPEDKDDYILAESNAVDSPVLTFVSNGFVASATYPYIRNLTTTYANNSESDVTITEVGYAQKSGTANSKAHNVLLTRTVLGKPIVVPKGKQVAITISLSLELE
jgi:hypothetical protein